MTFKRKPGAKVPDMGLLTDEDMALIKKDAADTVAKERHAAAVREASAIALDEERAKFDPALEMTDVLIDLPAFAPSLMIDFRYFHHGHVAHVSKPAAASIKEQMSRMWEQEVVMGSPNAKAYKPVRNYDLSAKTGTAVAAPVRPQLAHTF